MSDRLPASLAYLLIYNPTLPPPPNVSQDDEDAQEEAHILFYTSRERVVSRDRMLRQVGLAKAVVNFSEIFNPGQGCDNIHSQGRRMVSVSPEPDFWIHTCIDLAKSPKQNKDKSKGSKGDDPSPVSYHYHENSLHDQALRAYLLRGYEEFKLLHGTFTSVLKDSSRGTLEMDLERFFTPWAWRWDMDTVNEFGVHLGLPLHPLNRSLAPLISSFIEDLPSEATPIILSPPYIIDPSQPSVVPYPPSLPRHLCSLFASRGRPTLRRKESKGRGFSRGAPSDSCHDSGDPGATNNTLGFFSAAGAGMSEAMNIKKWNWPGAFTFGRSRSTSRTRQSGGANHNNTKNHNKLSGDSSVQATTTSLKPDEHKGNSEVTPDVQTHVEGSIDQSALDDAISSLNSPSQPNEPTPGVGINVVAEHGTIQHNEIHANVSSPTVGRQPGNEASGPPTDIKSSSSYGVPAQSPGTRFSIVTVFLSDPSESLAVRRRKVFYISLFELVFALLMDAEWLVDEVDERLQTLSNKVPEFLEEVRKAIDAGGASDTTAIPNPKSGMNRSRHIIRSPNNVVSLSTQSSTSSIFFENQEILARDPDTVEIFSRSASPQHWFVARRGLGFSKAGDKIQGEAYLQINNKEASLVDADNELVGTVRRWADQED